MAAYLRSRNPYRKGGKVQGPRKRENMYEEIGKIQNYF